ncbi:MAG: c-type cytochrome [Candidatus Tectomicrobia bacterium]|nr:c-type cytochrome [Candidatus Tectomicrobia bacterium]
MKKVVFKVILFNVLVILFYMYVGQIIPQIESHPPKEITIAAGMSATELAAVGKELFYSKGTCVLCHAIGEKGQRAPDLAGVGERAKTRKEGMKDFEYLAESLYNPTAYVVEGWQPIMPVINKPPINLSDDEIHAVVAYLQTLGGTPTVTLETKFAAATAPAAAAAPAAAMKVEGADAASRAKSILAQGGCIACHSLDKPDRLIGPSLFDIGKRKDRAYILESILEPDKVIAQGTPPYPPGLMLGTLQGIGFYQKVTAENLLTLVDYLSTLKGK